MHVYLVLSARSERLARDKRWECVHIVITLKESDVNLTYISCWGLLLAGHFPWAMPVYVYPRLPEILLNCCLYLDPSEF